MCPTYFIRVLYEGPYNAYAALEDDPDKDLFHPYRRNTAVSASQKRGESVENPEKSRNTVENTEESVDKTRVLCYVYVSAGRKLLPINRI